jgi:tetratricopeptide (TPR) repeat protein
VTAAGLLLAAAVGLVIADRLSARALEAANRSAPWARVRADLALAQKFAPWEVVYQRSWARAALLLDPRSFVPATLADASRGLTAAERMAPFDTAIVGDRADLLLSTAVVAGDRHTLRVAGAGYREAIRRDPNNAVYWLGLGRTQGLEGDASGAIISFTRAAVLAPRTRQTWLILARTYESQGKWSEAYRISQLAAVAGLR